MKGEGVLVLLALVALFCITGMINCEIEPMIMFDSPVDENIKKISNNIMNQYKRNNFDDAFRVADKNGDGYINTIEFINMPSSLGEKLTEEEAQDIIRDADIDGDGVLNIDEWRKINGYY